MTDVITSPQNYLDEYDGELNVYEVPPVLRDEGLWMELRAAQARLRDVEQRILAACTDEPFDALELECGRKMWKMLQEGDSGMEEWHALEEKLLEHAKTA